ncbi:MAG: RNA polymerase sigma factor [Deltaproteobacteria bacterium]|nr:RNA polymerase sigma factor [Deltaproteobacteria bacterium]MBW2360654.1 RNA polymerase sigma factor [Deltaproteobacteria bacterium]
MRNDPTGHEKPAPRTAARHDATLPLDDPEALGHLLLALEPRLRAVANRITRNPESARDVVQNAFEKVLRHGASFEGQARVSTWLHRIVTNEALMWLRSQQRRREVQSESDAPRLELLADAASSPAEQVEQRQNARQLHRVLGQLSAEERDVLLRCSLCEESYASYSRRSGLHPGAVKTRAFRGRRHLQALLASS